MEIEEMELNNGDPSWWTKGHVDKAEFLAVVNARFDQEFEEVDVRHTHQTSIRPARGREKPKEYEGQPYYWFCSPHDDGAEPVTVVHP